MGRIFGHSEQKLTGPRSAIYGLKSLIGLAADKGFLFLQRTNLTDIRRIPGHFEFYPQTVWETVRKGEFEGRYTISLCNPPLGSSPRCVLR